MTDRTSLGDRMKRFEEIPRIALTPRMPLLIRIDGRAFHTYTRSFERPWSTVIRDALTSSAIDLLHQISGAKIAYLQSDEISIFATDYDRLDSQAWFDKVTQKICSVTAAVATMAFNRSIFESGLSIRSMNATFDSRCWVLPREEVTNYFVWRQRDAERNSVASLAQSHFSHKSLHGKNNAAMQDMLVLEKGVNWNDLDTWKKRGWCVTRTTHEPEPGRIRTLIQPDWEIPIFSKSREYIERLLNPDLDAPEEPNNRVVP